MEHIIDGAAMFQHGARIGTHWGVQQGEGGVNLDRLQALPRCNAHGVKAKAHNLSIVVWMCEAYARRALLARQKISKGYCHKSKSSLEQFPTKEGEVMCE